MSSEITTIARPYAKAVFESAIASSKLSQWSDMLTVMTMVIMDQQAIDYVSNPSVNEEQQVDFMLTVCGSKLDEHGENLIRLLAHNKRLLVLPAIKTLFELSRSEHEKTLVVDVTSFSDLSGSQQQALSESLSKRFNRKVALKVAVDESILGGAIIRAGDVVIDGSVRGKLTKLHTELAA